MQLDKQQIIDFLRQQGDEGTATQAESDLPQQVDTDRDAGLLEKYGINIPTLLSHLGGDSGGGLGGLLK